MRKSVPWSGLCAGSVLLAVSVGAAANPVVNNVVANGLAHGDVITIQGKGFGTKAQAAPVLYDMGAVTYENGKLSCKQSGFADFQEVSRDGVGGVWAKPSSGAFGSSIPAVTFSRDKRFKEAPSHYYFTGKIGFLGWPNAYGGADTPVDNKQLYVAWWYKPKYDPRYYWVFPISNLKGKFIEEGANSFGEKLTVSSGVTGQVIKVENGQIHAIFDGQINKNNLAGMVVKGSRSGASADLATSGYLTPGSNKYIRVWEDPQGKEGIRVSWTQNQITGGPSSSWVYAPIKVGEWNLMELMLDTDTGKLQARVNSKHLTDYDLGTNPDIKGKYSPTIGLIGFDGSSQTSQEHEISEIYMDSSLQRVVIGNAETFDKVTHYEIQMPVKWQDNRVEAKLNLGTLSKTSNLYVYVFDKNGVVNNRGYALCDDCQAPPVAPVLKVSN